MTMTPHVELARVGEDRVILEPGDIIGRGWLSQLRIDDGRISEAHAMVSLRGAFLELLALRGSLACDGLPADRIRLEPGMQVELADGVRLQVHAVLLPDELLTLEGLPGGAVALVTREATVLSDGSVAARYVSDGLAWLWAVEDTWVIQRRGEDPTPVDSGWTGKIGLFEVTLVRRRRGSPSAVDTIRTKRPPGEIPLVITAKFDSAMIEGRGCDEYVLLTGLMARLVSELVLVAGPVHWKEVARLLWSNPQEEHRLRAQFDRLIHKIRHRTRVAGFRDDLIHADKNGNFQLVLRTTDVVINQC